VSLERIWAGWRSSYVSDLGTGGEDAGCVLCRLVGADDDAEALVLERTADTITVMNLYPYGSGHLMVAPVRHTPDVDDLTDDESASLMRALRRAVVALKRAYGPDGVNIGINQGAAAGAGIPGHLHVHVLPRWTGDTNFMTSVAEVRVLPEDLRTGYGKLRGAWPPAH
jgi:ATP adenylyltransferase